MKIDLSTHTIVAACEVGTTTLYLVPNEWLQSKVWSAGITDLQTVYDNHQDLVEQIEKFPEVECLTYGVY